MSAKRHIVRWKMTAILEGDLPYDPAKPESYAEALQFLAGKRKALQDMGATLVEDRAVPKVVRNGDV